MPLNANDEMLAGYADPDADPYAILFEYIVC